MNTFFGTKQIMARAMTRQEYNDYRGWELPADENGADAGFLVEYTDGGQANHPDHVGYISWSPAAVFANAYKANGAMNFGHALEALKSGGYVSRAGWNGKGMWLSLIEVYQVGYHPGIVGRTLLPWIGMRTADGAFVPWLASQTDMLANDWGIVQ